MEQELIHVQWRKRFMSLAKEISTWSKDPSTKVGSVIVKSKRVLSQGYNGFPSGFDSVNIETCERQTKYNYIIHAETNAIYNALRNGVSLNGSSIYVYGLLPCHECAKAIIQCGIRVVYTPEEHVTSQRNQNYDRRDWTESFQLSLEMFRECGVKTYLV